MQRSQRVQDRRLGHRDDVQGARREAAQQLEGRDAHVGVVVREQVRDREVAEAHHGVVVRQARAVARHALERAPELLPAGGEVGRVVVVRALGPLRAALGGAVGAALLVCGADLLGVAFPRGRLLLRRRAHHECAQKAFRRAAGAAAVRAAFRQRLRPAVRVRPPAKRAAAAALRRQVVLVLLRGPHCPLAGCDIRMCLWAASGRAARGFLASGGWR
mmetsp:Transcript_7028/g.20650  ORF Transcript_7028/g.20650 Transcript_7028/m.20650 type:complete len:217 (-) Transcript_7028:91-741(-)